MTGGCDTHDDTGSKARFLHNSWYVGAWSHELGSRPLRRKLLGRELAFFRDHRGDARAVSAVCPHRGSNLAAGRVVGGRLECPLHGWRFGGDGRCVRIPSQPEQAPIPKGARVPSFPLVEQQGLLWIWMGDPRQQPARPPRFDFWERGPGRRRLKDRPRLWPAPFVHVVEQTIDDSHPAFVHAGAVPERAPPVVAHERVTVDEGETGFRWEDDRTSPWQRPQTPMSGPHRFLRRWVQGVVEPRQRYARFERAGLIHLHVRNGDGRWDVIVVAITPCDAHHTWTFGESIRSRATHPVGELLQRRYLWSLFAEDQGIAKLLLYRNWRGFPTDSSVRADRSSLTFRKLYARWLEHERDMEAGYERPGAANGRSDA